MKTYGATLTLILCAACTAGTDDTSSATSTGGSAGQTTNTTTSSGGSGAGGSTASFMAGGGGAGGSLNCATDVPPTTAGPEAVLAPEYAGLYTVYDLGTVPGMPPGHLGGCVIKHDDPNTLLLAGDSETLSGAIYQIGVERGPCGHIVGFVGSATQIAQTEYVDANLVYGPSNTLFYTQWPTNQISQLLPGAASPAATLAAATIGIGGKDSVSGFGFVPPNLQGAGQPRTLTWSNGDWYQMTMEGAGPTYQLSNGVLKTTLPNGPGGFAYVPAGSPGFDLQSTIVAEWSTDSVATYQVDAEGDPLVATRKPFFTTFPRPWGAYFEPATGDFLFLTWGSLPDRVYIVQGFLPPPPPPPPPE
jgi:hypothetical protein